MSYCLNPDCPKPQNPETQKCCQGCGFNLWVQEHYRAIQLIGQGGFSRTFLAVNETESPCVLKQLWTKNLSPEAAEKAIALFQQEAQRLEELGHHPQIPTLIAHFEENQYLYLVQEFIDGMNLATVVEKEGTFSEAQIWQLLDELLPVLKFIHDHQIIHRDIKPENIIRPTRLHPSLSPLKREAAEPSISQGVGEGSPTPPFPSKDGGLGGLGLPYQGGVRQGQLVLVDFGAAKLSTGINSLKAGTRIGSPEYVAPEQARGKAVFASDLYSLGVTCIYLLTGIPPFDLFDVVNDRWVWRDYLTEEVSDRLGQILDKLLQNALTRRFQSVDEVMEAIARRHNRSAGVSAASEGEILPPSSTLWQCLHTLTGNSPINSVAISPDDQFLASGSEDKTIRVWNLETGEVLSTLTGHSQGVKSIAFSPDGTMLATGSDDQTIKVWDWKNEQEICTFAGHSHAVKSVAFSPDGQMLASGSWDKTIKLWNIQTSVEEKTLTGHRLQVSAVAFSSCGTILGSASCDRTVRLWDLTSGSSTVLYGHAWAVFAIAFSPDGKTLATASDDNTIRVWDQKTGKQLYTLSGHSWSVVALTYSSRTSPANSPDGETLVSGSWDKTIKLWQVSTGKELATLTGHLDSVYSVAISSNGQIIASGSKDKTIKLWHRRAG